MQVWWIGGVKLDAQRYFIDEKEKRLRRDSRSKEKIKQAGLRDEKSPGVVS